MCDSQCAGHRQLVRSLSTGDVSESCSLVRERFRALHGRDYDPSVFAVEDRPGERCREWDPEAGEWLPVAMKA